MPWIDWYDSLANMKRTTGSPLRRYGIGALAVAVATGLRLLLDPILEDKFPFVTLLFAVMVAAWYGGFGPALTATVVGALASAFAFLPPRGSFAVHGFENQTGLALFLAVSLGIAVLGGAMRTARLRAEQAEESQREERERLHVTLKSIGDAVIATDSEGRVTFLNPLAQEFVGWAMEEAAGLPLPEVFLIVNEVTRQPVENPALRALKEGKIVGLANHTVLISKDGTERAIDDSAAPIRNERGDVSGSVLVFRDITERKRSEAALGERLRLLALNAAVGEALVQGNSLTAMLQRCAEGLVRHLDGAFARIWTLDPTEDVLILRASAGMYTHLDGPHSRVPVGKYKIGFIAKEGTPHLTNSVIGDPRVSDQEWAKREGMVAFAGYPLVVDGRVIGVMAMFARIPLTEATLGAMASVANGIAVGVERKTAEEDRRSEQEWLRVTLASIGDAVIATDIHGQVTFLNGVAQRLTGWSLAEAEGQPLEKVFPIINEQTRRPFTNPVEKVLREGVIVGLANHTLLVARDGTERPIDDSAAPIRDGAGKMLGVVLIFRDVTEQRRTERTLRESEERFARFMQSFPGLAWIKDSQGRYVYANDAALTAFGVPQPDLYGKTDEQVFPSRTAAQFKQHDRQAVTSGDSIKVVEALEHPDGALRHSLVSKFPIHGPDGRPALVGGMAIDISDRLRAEEALRQSEEHLRAVVETTQACIKVVAPDGLLLDMNSAGLAMVDADGPENVKGKCVYTLVCDEYRDAFREFNERVCRGEKGSLEFEIVGLRGTRRHMETYAVPLRWPGGGFVQLAITHDITARKRAEAELRHSEERFRSLMEQAPFSIQVFSPDGRTIRVNRAWEALWGVRFEQIEGYNVLEDRQLEAKGVLQHIQQGFTGQAARIPAIQYNPNETIPDITLHEDPRRWLSAVIYPLTDADGHVREVVLIHEDITARKRAEDALRESEEKLRLLADTIPQLAWMARPDGYIFWYNRRWYEYTGTTPEQMEGWGWQSVHDPEVLPKVLERWKGSIASGEPFDMVFPLKGADDTFRSFLTRVNPLRDDEGRILYWFGTNTDISDIKRMEEALRDADRRKDEFLATLAHELRNPLAPIRNSLQILKMPRVDSATVQQTRDMMERQVHHLVRLVDDLLDVSRVMRGKIELRREAVELATIVARAVETAQPLIEVQGHQLDISLQHESLLLDADPVRLAQVVGNLLTNSAKYTEANGNIWLTAARENGQAVLKVRDSGIGIGPDMLPHVFELFVQVDHASTKAQGGLGIGLTLVKNLVEMHGGTVEAFSTGLGEGCEFVVRLPLMVGEGQQSDDKGKGELQQEPSRPSGHRLLVVDDNQDAAISLAMLLKLQGHEVRVAHNGPAALEMTEGYAPDVVFLDIGMPGMDGYEVARRLRQQPGLENVVLAALTGWGQQEDRRRTAEAGFNHHLVKPPEPQAVASVLAGLKRREVR